MKKNPFKKQGIIDTAINVGIGGAANVAMDYAVSVIDALSSLSSTTINAIKIGVGVLGGTMTTNKMIHAATDGIAVVGVSNLVQGILDGTSTTSVQSAPASGLPKGTVGGARLGNRAYRRHVSGVPGFMSK